MITANLVQTWELYHLAQAHSLVLMKNVLTVIINQAASPVTTGILPLKPAPHNAHILIDLLVPAPAIPAVAVRLAVENIKHVLVPATIFGAEVLVPLKVIV